MVTGAVRDTLPFSFNFDFLIYLASFMFLKSVSCGIRRSLNEAQYPFDYGDNNCS